MKKYTYLLFLLLMACQSKKTQTTNLVSVSILPQKFIVEQIAGDLLKINVLVPPGSSPHNYTVLPSQMKDLAKSTLWLQIGLLTFEDAWKEKFAEINPELNIVNCSDGVDLIYGSECADEEHQHQHAEVSDPHIWLAPAEMKILALNSLNALKKEFPEYIDTFEKNYSTLISGIDTISIRIEAKINPLQTRSILIFHPALAYYARQYNLTQIPLELDGKEPSPKHMKNIVDQAKVLNIRVVFIQKEFDTENALQLAREINGEVLVIDPLDYNWEKQMLDITEKIASQK